jgi:hypothetical protein
VSGDLVMAPTYRITWVSEEETLATDIVISNAVPVYTGELPAKRPDENGFYAFAGWTPVPEATVSNTTYAATFTTVGTCEIRWTAEGNVVKAVTVTNGTPASAIAAMAPSGADIGVGADLDPFAYRNKRFTGWNPATYSDATENAEYAAVFEDIYHLTGIVPDTLRFTGIKVNGRKVAVTFEFKPTGMDADVYRLIYKTEIDSEETFVSDTANVIVTSGDANVGTAIAEVMLPEECEAKAFFTGLDFAESGED